MNATETVWFALTLDTVYDAEVSPLTVLPSSFQDCTSKPELGKAVNVLLPP